MNLNTHRRCAGRFCDRKCRSNAGVLEQPAYPLKRGLFFALKPIAIVTKHSWAQGNCLAFPKGTFCDRAVAWATKEVGEQRPREFPAMLIEPSGLAVSNQHASLLDEAKHGIRLRV